ncbi:hypothetical protein M758_3G257400 [Ceratodon purpureus]|nr:hypothetical protein M758_3G257400 [Ceratodon purpureus]
MAQLVSRMSGLPISKSGDDESTQARCLELTKECMVRAQKFTAEPNRPTSPKFNYEQCKYLADKLTSAVESADSFLELLNSGHYCFPSSEETANCLEIFKLLHAIAMEVENFIQSCCKDQWIQAAVALINVSGHVSSLGFNLILWTVVFSNSKDLKPRHSLTLADVDNLVKVEVGIVNAKASLDREVLLRKLNAVLQIQHSTSEEYQLAVHLLDRRRNVLDRDSSRASPSSPPSTGMKSLERKESLGKGSSGTVHRAKWLGVEVAQKTFYTPNFPDFEKEVSNLAGLSHPNIASLLYSVKDKRECTIVMELMDEDLFHLIQRRFQNVETRKFPFGILEGVEIMLQIGDGMNYLHGLKIVHRDLKSMNILVKCLKSTELEIEYVQVKVADFGMSKTKEKSMTYSNQTSTGTDRWMAPELIKSRSIQSRVEKLDGEAMVMKYPLKSDIYSFAMVCYEILTGNMPFSSTSNMVDLKNKVLKGLRPTIPSECPLILKRLIERCWSLDASKRPSFADICSELRHLKYLFLMPSGLRNVSSPLNKSVQSSASFDTQEGIARSSMPIGFKKGADLAVQRWMVGLDIGTTESGFAYAKGSHLHQMHVNYAYLYAEKPYWKDSTALYFRQIGPGITSRNAESWGHRAHVEYVVDNVQNSQRGFYVPDFKLLLLKDLHKYSSKALGLPYPLEVKSLITEYLKHIGEHALTEIKNCTQSEGSFSGDSVQWCVTVPSSWSNSAKQQIKECMVKAGLVSINRVADSVVVFLKSKAGFILLTPATFTPVLASVI